MMFPYLYLDLTSYINKWFPGAPINEVLSDEKVVSEAREIIELALTKGSLEEKEWNSLSVLALHLSLAAAAKTNSAIIIRKLIKSVSKKAIIDLQREDSKTLLRASKALGINVREENLSIPWALENNRVVPKILGFSISLHNYLLLINDFDEELSLPNAFLLNGKIYLDKIRLSLIISKAVENRLILLVNKYRESDMPVANALAKRIIEIDKNLLKNKFNYNLIPICLRKLIEKGERTQLNDEEIYEIISFLKSIRTNDETIMDILFRARLADASTAHTIARALSELELFTPYTCKGKGREICIPCPRGGIVREYFRNLRSKGRDHHRRS